MVRLSNNGLMKISITQVIKVKVTVTNSLGDVAYDIYEFFLNDSPFVGVLEVTTPFQNVNATHRSIDT